MTLNLRQSLNYLEKSIILLSGKFSSSWKSPLSFWKATPSKFPCSCLHLHYTHLHTAAPTMSHLLSLMLIALTQCQQILRRIWHTTQQKGFLPARKVTAVFGAGLLGPLVGQGIMILFPTHQPSQPWPCHLALRKSTNEKTIHHSCNSPRMI